MSKHEPIEQTWERYRRHAEDADRNTLVEHYLPIVKYLGARLWARVPDSVELDDLVSAGVFGLIDAIARFDGTRGVKFESYCQQRIRGAMLDELRDMDWVPRLVRCKASLLRGAARLLELTLRREPTVEELAAKLGMSVKIVEQMQAETRAVELISLSKTWFELDGWKSVRMVETVIDRKGEGPTRRLQHADVMRLVTKGLNRTERLIVILYYYEELTMKQIGKAVGLSESRVSQVHGSILRRLEKRLAGRQPEFAVA